MLATVAQGHNIDQAVFALLMINLTLDLQVNLGSAKPANLTGTQWAVKSRLAGLKTITISAPGVLLEEWSVEELEACSPQTPPPGGDFIKLMASGPFVGPMPSSRKTEGNT